MKKDNLAFLVGGLLFGTLIGFGAPYVWEHRPGVPSSRNDGGRAAVATAPTPSQIGNAVGPVAQADPPMMAELGALKERIAEEPGDLAALTRLANLHHDVGMWEQAIGYYERALEISPRDPDLLTDAGICYQAVGRYPEAMGLFDRAQEADPSHWQSLFNTVVVAGLRMGDLARADAALARLESVHPAAPRLDELRAQIERVRRQSDERGGS